MAPRVRSQRSQTATPAPETSVARTTRSRSASIAKLKSASNVASSAARKMTRARSASVTKSKDPKSSSVPSFQLPTVASTNKSRANSSTPGPDAKVSKKAVKPVTKKATRATSPTPTVTTAKPVTKKAAVPKPVPSEPQRDAYGSARASTESRLMAEHSSLLLKHNVIDADTAAKLSTPWHKTGVLSQQWDKKYLQERNPTLKEDGEIMDLEKARRIAAKKDAAERKWVADFEAGRIDEDGKRILSPSQSNVDVDVSSGSDIEILPPPSQKKVAAPKKAATPKKEAIKKVASGRVAKPSQAAKKMALPPIPEAEEPQDPFSTVPPSPPPAVKPASGAKPKSRPRKAKPANFIVPEKGAENYEQYSYMQLLAIGRERGLMTGGDEWKVRERLISDDKAVREGREREVATYGRSGARKFQTKAPAVAKAPSSVKGKRKRSVVEEGSGEDSAAKKQKAE